MEKTNEERDMSKEAINNLRTNQTQLDMDGAMVGVSRQAVEETLAYIDRLKQALQDAGCRSNICTASSARLAPVIPCWLASRRR